MILVVYRTVISSGCNQFISVESGSCVLLSSRCCLNPGEAQFANITYQSMLSDAAFLLPGDYYTYSCNYGYQHADGGQDRNITCLSNGTWTDPGKAPACRVKSCPDPGMHS